MRGLAGEKRCTLRETGVLGTDFFKEKAERLRAGLGKKLCRLHIREMISAELVLSFFILN
jgi:hypothetical protein